MASAKKRYLVEAKVTDAEKRRYPSKHYVYVIQVSWDDGSDTVIFRRYSKFFDFQITLLESFPTEGGIKDPSTRTIPFLPGKILFRRSHIRDVAMKRLKPIDEYCQALLLLPDHISKSDHVLDFFESKPEDLHPPKEEMKRRKKEEAIAKHKPVRRTKSLGFDRKRKPTRSVSFNAADIGEISGPILLEQYRAIADYTRNQPKELSVVSGQVVEVIEKHENGWWFVNDEEGERGWVPGVYLEKKDGSSEDLVTKQCQPGEGEKYITTAKFTGSQDEISFGVGVLVEVLQKNLEGWWLVSYKGKQGWAPASYLEKPAEAVLRQTNKVEVISSVRDLRGHRRSLPAETMRAIAPPSTVTCAAVSSARSSPRHLQLGKTNSDAHNSRIKTVAATFSKSSRKPQTPPPKKSSVKRKGSFAQKPQVPPPLPPAPDLIAEPVYEYVTTSSFSATIPHGISFKEEKKVKVIEKSPGDWWYIELDGEEGWAPASYIKKEFKCKPLQNKPTLPPGRPKPPKVPENKSQDQSLKVLENKVVKPVEKKDSFVATSQVKSNVVKNTLSQKPLPPVPAPPSTASSLNKTAKFESKATTSENIPFPNKNIQARPKPPILKIATNKQAENESENTAKFDFKNALKSAVADKVKEPPKPTPPRPVSKPAVVSNKPLQNGDAKNLKPVTVANALPKKPPPPSAGKKPLVLKKTMPMDTTTSSDSKEPGQVDFRSILRSTAPKPNAISNGINKRSEAMLKKPPSLPGKPALKPSTNLTPKNSFNKSDNLPAFKSSDLNRTASTGMKRPELPKAKPTKPESKPVLKRFQTNGNNSNNIKPQEESNIVVVGRVQSNQIVPNTALPFMLRGCPDGQVDDPKTEEGLLSDNKQNPTFKTVSDDVQKMYLAVADFKPEDESEIGFAKGAEALLIKKSETDWWYMQIKDEFGWAPCNFFKLTSEVTENNTNKNISTTSQVQKPGGTNTKEDLAVVTSRVANLNYEEAEMEPIYSEIDEENVTSQPISELNMYVTGAAFEATDDTMISLGSGDIVEALDKSGTGWWYVKVLFSSMSHKDNEGWVPSDYLDKI
ncbi:unnamed protein product [Clavelina lepadiformis]|uniref:SH3 and PX domain-containing protein 2A n=1 Tax=Clavelina lepadiformis TaxID=159417 RepID=A0ABP0F7E3_CLALP